MTVSYTCVWPVLEYQVQEHATAHHHQELERVERASSDESGDLAPPRRPPTGELSDGDLNDDSRAASSRAGSNKGEAHSSAVAEPSALIAETKREPDSNTAAAVAVTAPGKTPSPKIYNADTGRFYTKSTADEVDDTDSGSEPEEVKEDNKAGANEKEGEGAPASKLSSFMIATPSGSRLSPGALEKFKAAEENEKAATVTPAATMSETTISSPLPDRSIGKGNSFTKFIMSEEEANMNGAPGKPSRISISGQLILFHFDI